MKPSQFSLLSIVLCAFTFTGWHVSERMPDEKLHIHVFETDEGDAMLIKTPEGHFITIDGGINRTAISSFFREKWFWDRKIDLLILTHPDSDHINGAYELLQSFAVEKILFTGVQKDQEIYKNFISLAKEKNIPMVFADQWSDIQAGSVFLDTVYPLTSLAEKTVEASNNTSIIFQLRYFNFEMLFTGDIEADKEKILLTNGTPLKSDVLKVAHHGSNTSSSLPFLKSVQPKSAIFSVGQKTRFPHPAPAIVQRFTDLQIPTWNTKNGEVEIVVDADQFCILQKKEEKCMKNEG